MSNRSSDPDAKVVRRRSLAARALYRAVNLISFGTLDRLAAIEALLSGLSLRLDGLERRQETLDLRIQEVNQANARRCEEISHELGRVSELDPIVRSLQGRMDRAEWGREALVERMNQDDAHRYGFAHRLELAEGRLQSISSQSQALSALAWDTLAMTRRLAVLEDRTEALLQAGEGATSPGVALIAYPSESKAAG